MNNIEIRNLNVQSLAFIGDAVYSLIVRQRILLDNKNLKTNEINKLCNKVVNANAQSELILKIINNLTEEEKGIFLRARNYKTKNSAKNASIINYHNATGFEAVLGYLYLTKNYDRIFEILNLK